MRQIEKTLNRAPFWAVFLFFCLHSAADSGQLSKLKALLEKSPDNTKVRSQIAQILIQTKNSEQKLIELLNPYADEVPIEIQLILARSYRRLKQFKDELRVLKKVVTKAPNNHKAYLALGYAHLKVEEVDKAIFSFRRAIQLNKKYTEAYKALLEVFEKSYNNYESRIILQDMLKQVGKKPASYSHLCRLDSTDGYLEIAIQNCRKAIKMDPKHPDNHVYLAQSLSDQKNESEAGKILLRASKKYLKSEFVQWATGQYYFRQNNFPMAAKYFRRAISADIQSARAHLGFALSIFEQKQYDKALQAFAKACETDESTLEKLRKALGTLRTENKMDWSRRYSHQIYKCKKLRSQKSRNTSRKFGK